MPAFSSLSLNAIDRATIADVLEGIRHTWPVERVILFGSKARGDDEADSDIDLLVITSEPVSREQEDAMQEVAWQAGMRHRVPVQLVVRSHDRWWHGIDQATPLRMQIDTDGVEVFCCDR